MKGRTENFYCTIIYIHILFYNLEDFVTLYSWWYYFKCLFLSFPSYDPITSAAQLCPILWDPMNHSTPGVPIHHQLWSPPKPMSIVSVMPSSHLCSVIPFSSCPQSFPALGSFLMSQLFAWGGQSIGVSASTSVLPMNTQDWFPLGWTGWIFLQSNGLSRVFTNTIVQKHQFFGDQLSSPSNSHIHTWPLENQ